MNVKLHSLYVLMTKCSNYSQQKTT